MYYTADMVRAIFEDGKRYEVVQGERLVSPAPRAWHQEVTFRLGWVVEPDDRCLEVWTPEALFPVIEESRVVWQPAGSAEPLVVDLEPLFRPL